MVSNNIAMEHLNYTILLNGVYAMERFYNQPASRPCIIDTDEF